MWLRIWPTEHHVTSEPVTFFGTTKHNGFRFSVTIISVRFFFDEAVWTHIVHPSNGVRWGVCGGFFSIL